MSFIAPAISAATSVFGAINQFRSADEYDDAIQQQIYGAEELEDAAKFQEASALLVSQAANALRGVVDEQNRAAYEQAIAARLLERTARGTAEAAFRARQLSQLNAAFTENETHEEVRRLRWQHRRTQESAIARAAASGVAYMGSPVRHVEEMEQVLDDEVSWLFRSMGNRTAIQLYEGRIAELAGLAEAEAVRAQAKAGIAGARITAAGARATHAQTRQLEAERLQILAGAKQTLAQAKQARAGARGTRAQQRTTRVSAIGTGLNAVSRLGDAFNWWQPSATALEIA